MLSLFKFGEFVANLQVARVQFAFKMHGETLVSVEGGLEGATNFANFHVLVLLYNGIVNEGF